MTDEAAAQRIVLLLDVPEPQPATTKPLTVAGDVSHNSLIGSWWQERNQLAAQLAQFNRQSRAGQWSGAVEAYEATKSAVTATSRVWALWRRIYRKLLAAGSSRQYSTNFVPVWQTRWPANRLLYTFEGDRRPCRYRKHSSASLVWESVAMLTALYALRHQLAACAVVAERTDCHKDDMTDAYDTERAALATMQQLLHDWLPMHYSALNGSETPLMSEHYHLHFAARVLRAHCNYYDMQRCSGLRAVARLAHASTLMADTQQTGMVDRKSVV